LWSLVGVALLLVGAYFAASSFYAFRVDTSHKDGAITITRSSWWGFHSTERQLRWFDGDDSEVARWKERTNSESDWTDLPERSLTPLDF